MSTQVRVEQQAYRDAGLTLGSYVFRIVSKELMPGDRRFTAFNLRAYTVESIAVLSVRIQKFDGRPMIVLNDGVKDENGIPVKPLFVPAGGIRQGKEGFVAAVDENISKILKNPESGMQLYGDLDTVEAIVKGLNDNVVRSVAAFVKDMTKITTGLTKTKEANDAHFKELKEQSYYV